MRTLSPRYLVLAAAALFSLCLAARQASAQNCAPPPPSMVAWYPGDNDANDVAGTNNGTLNGSVTFAPGEVNAAFSFGGGFVQVPDAPALNPGSQITIDAWINRSNNTGRIVDKITPGGQDGYLLDVFNGQVRLIIGNQFVMSAQTLPLNSFVHVAGVYDGAQLRLYINGALDASQSAALAIPTNSLPLRLGADQSGANAFNGLIDEAEIFNRALTPGEIQAIFQAGPAGKCHLCAAPPPGMGLWLAGDGNATDLSGNGNNGTLQGGATFAPGKVGQAFSFDGVGGFVTVPDSPLLKPANVTVDAWVKFNSLDSVVTGGATPGLQFIIFKRNSRTLQFEGYALLKSRVSGVDRLSFVIASASGQEVSAVSTTAVTTGQFYHVAGSYDGSNVKIYVNGVLETQTPATFPLDYGTQPLVLGATNEGFDGKLSGVLDEAEVFNRALADTEVASIAHADSAGKCRACAAPPTGLVSWYPGDGSAADIQDGNNGTLQGGATFAPGKVGQAFSFNGSGWVSVPDATNLHFTTQFTLDAWVNPADLSDFPMIFSKFGSANDSSYELHLQPDGSVRANVSGNGATNDALISSAGVVSTGIWSHVTTTFNAGDWKIYVNGVQVAAKTSAVTSVFPGTATLLIGRDVGATHFFNGLIDEAELFNSALSAADVAAIANAGGAGKCRALGAHDVLISELRLRGANGANDEFIELYNNTNAPITAQAADATPGWALAAADGVARLVVPNGVSIPPRGHYLITNAGGYSLSDYGGAGRAAGDGFYTQDIPDDTGVALFKTADPAGFNCANQLDAVGFTSQVALASKRGAGARGVSLTCSLYSEGTPLAGTGGAGGEYSFVRKLTTGLPQDTDDNASDFAFVSTSAGNFGGAQSQLGAPGPENTHSPVQRNATVKASFVDPQCSGNGAAASACARVRDATSGGAGTPTAFGTISFRRTFTNMTGAPVTTLRFRVVDITTLNSPGYSPGGAQADLRLLSNADVTVTRADTSTVTLKSLDVEEPPAQPLGGGLNSTVAVVSITPATPLAPGTSVSVQFTFGVAQGGFFRAFVNTEAVTDSPAPPPFSPNKGGARLTSSPAASEKQGRAGKKKQ